MAIDTVEERLFFLINIPLPNGAINTTADRKILLWVYPYTGGDIKKVTGVLLEDIKKVAGVTLANIKKVTGVNN